MTPDATLTKYINSPVQLLQGILLNPPAFARRVVLYGGYYHVYSEKASIKDVEDLQVDFDFDLSSFDIGEK